MDFNHTEYILRSNHRIQNYFLSRHKLAKQCELRKLNHTSDNGSRVLYPYSEWGILEYMERLGFKPLYYLDKLINDFPLHRSHQKISELKAEILKFNQNSFNSDDVKDKRVCELFHRYTVILIYYAQKIRDYEKVKNTGYNKAIREMWGKKFDDFYKRWLPLIIQIEDYYIPSVTGIIADESEFAETIKPTADVLKSLNITIEELIEFRVQLSLAINSLSEVSDNILNLVQYQFKMKKEFKGKTLFAIDFIEISNMIRYFLADLTGERQPLDDEIFDGRKGEWKKQYFDRLPEPHDLDLLQFTLNRLNLKPTPRLTLVCEDIAEREFFNEIYSGKLLNRHALGINLMYLGGGGREFNNLRDYIVKSLVPDLMQGNLGSDENDKNIALLKYNPTPIIFLYDKDNKTKQQISQKHSGIKNSVKDQIIKYISPNSQSLERLDAYLEAGFSYYIQDPDLEFNYLDTSQLTTFCNLMISKDNNNEDLITEGDILRLKGSPRNSGSQLIDLLESRGHFTNKPKFAKNMGAYIAELVKSGISIERLDDLEKMMFDKIVSFSRVDMM